MRKFVFLGPCGPHPDEDPYLNCLNTQAVLKTLSSTDCVWVRCAARDNPLTHHAVGNSVEANLLLLKPGKTHQTGMGRYISCLLSSTQASLAKRFATATTAMFWPRRFFSRDAQRHSASSGRLSQNISNARAP
jgi:hypothetical protein